MEERGEHAPHLRRRVITTIAGGVVAGALALGLSVAALTRAGAQAPSPTPSATKAPSEKAWPGEGMRGLRGIDHGKLGIGGIRGFGGPGIHGELTTKKPGGYQTLATQTGEVTSVSSSSIAVKSEDGFSRTYSVDDTTGVMAGNEGIADVKKGDSVRVLAVVEGDKARSLHVIDLSNLKELRGKLKPPPPDPKES